MKKIIYFLTFSVLIITAFGPSADNSVSQTQTTYDAIAATLDMFHKSFGNRDTATLRTILTNPGLYGGTDPMEISNDRDFVLDYLMNSYFADTATAYSVNSREIQIAGDEKSAIAVEQFIYPPRSKIFATRCNIHLVKINKKWMIDSFVHSLVISTDDMEKINSVMPK